jgi:hypothetical protein
MEDMSSIASEDIKAEVEKTHARLWFAGSVLLMALIGYFIHEVTHAAPELNHSVECTKAGGQWVPEDNKVIAGNTHHIDGYCGPKKP